MTEIKQIFVQHQKKMKKLIVHIGYPKTATTTLQVNVFYNLYKSGKINFLGRASMAKDSVLENRVKLFRSVLILMSPKSRLLMPPTEEELQEALDNYKERDHQEKIDLLRGLLNQNLVNLHSEEGYLAPYWLLTGFKTNPISLKTIFDDGKTEIKILIVLRAQQKLMQSMFAQCYNGIFRKRKDFDTPSKLYFNEVKNLELKAGEYSEIFNFYNVISSYSDVFGRDNVKILLFEDLINDRPYFISQLSEILGVEPELIDSYIENEKPQNVKTRKNEKYVLEKKHDNFLVRMLFRVQKALPKSIESTIKNYTPLKTFFNNLLIKESVEVPELTADEKKAIFEFYQKSNILLADEFGISVEKLKKYQYI